MIIGHVMFIAVILFSIWAIIKTWSKPYREFMDERAKRLPTYLKWLYFKDSKNRVTEMRAIAIITFIFFLH